MTGKIEWVGPWADAKYRKKHLRKPVGYGVWENITGWEVLTEQLDVPSLAEAKRRALLRCEIAPVAILAFNPFPPTTIAIVYPGGE